MPSPGTIFDTPIARERFLATIGFASFVAVVQTWGSVPWSWGFPIVFTSLAAILRAGGRSRRPESWMAWPLLPAATAGILTRLFYGSDYSWQGAIHAAGVLGLSLLLGIWIGNQLPTRPHREGGDG